MKFFWFWIKLEILFLFFIFICAVLIVWLLTQKIQAVIFLLDYTKLFTLGTDHDNHMAFAFRWMLIIVATLYATLLSLAIDFKTRIRK